MKELVRVTVNFWALLFETCNCSSTFPQLVQPLQCCYQALYL